jgi:hygromycin-B 4-O-kinase
MSTTVSDDIPPVDSDALAAFLAHHYGTDPGDVGEIGRGEWSVAFGFTLRAEPYVIRLSQTDDGFRKDRSALRFASAALPMPEIIEIGAAFDGFFAVSPRVPGRFLESLDAGQMQAKIPAVFAALDAARTAALDPD